MVYCVGLTGTIASGKSTVANCFSILGIDIISADAIAKSLTEKTQPAFQDIVHHFGHSILTPAGDLDRPKLRELIFKDPTERLWLEQQLHPLIKDEIKRQTETVTSPYCLIEIPLLTNRANYPYLNRVLFIEAHPTQQVTRCTARDNSAKQDTLAILAAQPSTQQYLAIADDVLKNTGSLSALSNKVLALHKKYLGYT